MHGKGEDEEELKKVVCVGGGGVSFFLQFKSMQVSTHLVYSIFLPA